MTHVLSDMELVLLSAAAQRKDRCFVLAEPPKRAASRKAGARLLKRGFAQEIKARRGAPVWREEDEAGFTLRATVAGLKAIVVEDDESSAEAVGAPVSLVGAPRPGSKLASVINMLQGEGGATVGELIAATGWLAHTTRAALTGLRKRGYAIHLDRSDPARGSAYRIAA